jgi:hypothetical protein
MLSQPTAAPGRAIRLLRYGVIPIMSALLAAAPLAGAQAADTKPAEAASTPAAEPAGKLQHLAPTEAASVLGRPVRGADGKDIGRIVDVLVDQAGHPRAAVIDFGGFLGVGSRKIAVDWHTLHFTPNEPDKPITLELTPDQIKAAPEYKPGSTPTVVTAPPPANKPAEAATPPPPPPPAPNPPPAAAAPPATPAVAKPSPADQTPNPGAAATGGAGSGSGNH